jgi:glycosyltransferase involved in cell wall biosynthesis
MEKKYQKICIVALFFHQAFFIPLSHIREIIIEISPRSYSIIAVLPDLAEKMIFDFEKDDIIIYKNQINPFFRAITYFFLNLKISWSIIFRSKDVDCFLFFMETGLPLPMIIAKLRNKRVIWLLPSSLSQRSKHLNTFLELILKPLHSLSYNIVDKIVLYSQNLIKEWKLQNYSDKIFISHEHYININIFSVTTPLNDRPSYIGYIGRLSEEKGIQNFVQALPIILNVRKDICVLIIGDGILKEMIEMILENEGLADRVNLINWISHNNLPEYLNKLRLLVIPSYTEGLPNIMLEAMICGTPVLATPVGAIPDILKEGETGFIMENNSPACITENINRALDSQNIEKISMNAKKMIETEFTFNKTVKRWKKLLDEM